MGEITITITLTYKHTFSIFYNTQKIKNINYEQFSFDDLRLIVKDSYNDIAVFWDNKSHGIILLSMLLTIQFILIYFVTAIIFDFFYNNLSYILIITTWTLLFTLFFYIHFYRFYNSSRREIYIYLLLIVLYILALMFKRNIFDNLILLYQPFDNYFRNKQIQTLLYNYLKKYSDYLIDWALIQGIILSILFYSDFGNKRQLRCEQKFNIRKKELNAIYLLINILEEINNDKYFLEYCQKIKLGLINKNIIYNNKIADYHNEVKNIYSEIAQSDFKWLLDISPLDLVSNQTFINTYIGKNEKAKLKVCPKCQCAFFDSSNNLLCKECIKIFSIK